MALRSLIRRTVPCLSRRLTWPQWLKDVSLADDKWTAQFDISFKHPDSYEEAPFDLKLLDGCEIHETLRNRLCLNEPSKRYVLVGKAHGFPSPDDNPVISDYGVPAHLYWDASSPTPKLLVQLTPHIPPALWIPIRPSTDALARLFSETLKADLVAGRDDIIFFEKIQSEVETETGRDLADSDLSLFHERFIDTIRERDPADLTVDFPRFERYLFGYVPDLEAVEVSFLRNPFVSCFPIVLAERNHHQTDDRVKVCLFRTVASKSVIGLETREDVLASPVLVPSDADDPCHDLDAGLARADKDLEKHVDTRIPAYLLTNFAPNKRMCGAGAVVRRYNHLLGTSFAPDTPVDVIAASIPALPQDARSVAAMLRHLLGATETLTKDVAEVAEALRIHGAAGRTGDVAHERRKVLDLNEALVAVASHVVHLAVLRDPAGEWNELTKPLMNHPRAMVRLAVAKGAAELGHRTVVEGILQLETSERNARVFRQLLSEWDDASVNRAISMELAAKRMNEKPPVLRDASGNPVPDDEPIDLTALQPPAQAK
eukprot:TRINITY_DN45218_c0_g1_i1.p1 TRINITY_DN45218_c0_g1~~TRINITY_DN45218_c0_g1_i1.p1  ORF type:complete len:544 (+),score=41.85 TRINITY_DN45218_c0_g1_i1:97-1728(+)